jgi:hypothetical protein
LNWRQKRESPADMAAPDTCWYDFAANNQAVSPFLAAPIGFGMVAIS